MTRKNGLSVLTGPLVGGFLVLTLMLMTGCPNPPVGRTNAPPQGASTTRPSIADNYEPMVDNALLEEMSMSSVHFVPHRSELNSLGARRLNRYVPILKTYGGDLWYDGPPEDEDLVDARIEQIKKYLIAQGLDSDRFEAKEGLTGGRGMPAENVQLINKQTSFGGGLSVLPMLSPGSAYKPGGRAGNN